MKLHFVGIAGSGMSALAQIYAAEGHTVQGSDRSFDRGHHPETWSMLEAQGITIVPQDGTALDANIDEVVTSTAVEASIPDVQQARQLGLTLVHRSDALARLVNTRDSIAISGTSGKSTITGMLGVILAEAGRDPLVLNGGKVVNFRNETMLGNARPGSGPVVVEADESDGTLVKYSPTWGLVSNITLDHQPIDELRPLFESFAERCKKGGATIASSQRRAGIFVPGHWDTYGPEARQFCAVDVEPAKWGSRFSVAGHVVELNVPGLHNVENALGAGVLATLMGCSWQEIIHGLSQFKGVHRRLEHVASLQNTHFIDDFAHNPDKIEASLRTLTTAFPSIFVAFQWHGFGPARMLGEETAAVFQKWLRPSDTLAVLPVYYAGGTTAADFDTAGFAEQISPDDSRVFFLEQRDQLREIVTKWVKVRTTSDRRAIVIMGARDDSLSSVLQELIADVNTTLQ